METGIHSQSPLAFHARTMNIGVPFPITPVGTTPVETEPESFSMPALIRTYDPSDCSPKI